MNNIFVLNKNYKKIGTLSNQGAKPQAPYYNDLYTQELDTGADTYQFSTISNAYTQDCIEIGNHIMFAYKNRNELFTITSIEYSHSEGYKTIGVYAEGIGFELLEVYMEKPKVSNSGGTDNDNDGDDDTDDEYADVDDVYLDENGIIIYDKNGGTKPSEDDVYVDENGIIIYKRSKNNKNNDSLEFKNISYPTFLNVLLKNTGWSFVCQPGLESIKHDITVRYDTNIYAILQDSMQSYRGVELEFVHEYNNGKVQKTIKAYKDGGRGSFIGKRFEYGTNVKGITKTQKVANSKDDTVLYVDDVGIEVFYDVDFALKSAEVPEIEIGDTHYVIDTDFHPPMNIKARIGKIEVSFTDPTKNKIYLANNKKISGSAIDDELNTDDVLDILDDYDNSNGDDGGDGDDGNDGESANLPIITYENTKYYAMSEPIHDGYKYVDSVRGIYISRYDPNWPSEPPLLLGAGQFGRDILNAYTVTANTFRARDGDGISGGIVNCVRLIYKMLQDVSDISQKENIRYIDASTMPAMYNDDGSNVYKENLETRDYSSEELLEKADLYDFIVNQVNICEYNYIGNPTEQIGFIANEYEGTKVGDKIVVRQGEDESLVYNVNNLLFATIGALQEEVRIKDEKIADLEARLARVEAMLGINNDN